MPNRRILVVEDDVSLRSLFADILRTADLEVIEAEEGGEALRVLSAEKVGLVLCDEKMSPMDGSAFLREVQRRLPGLPVLMISGYATVKLAVEAIHHGAVDYLVKPIGAAELLEAVDKYLPRDSAGGQAACGGTPNGMELVAVDPRSRELRAMADRAATTNTTVLLQGASGVGKEVVARHIHRQSERAAGPFVAINCAAIPSTMLEAVLFGYEKGAFTGALNRVVGKFESAQQGTLLLDEISEMELDLQAKLLRVLQEKEVERLGGRETIKLDVRIIATTNRNLSREVQEGGFRSDLFYRLSVFPLEIPSLAERPGDILPLTQHILRRLARDEQKQITGLAEEAERALLGYHWPGNVRELENVLQRALILADGSRLRASHLKFDGQRPADWGGAASLAREASQENLRAALQEKESEQLLQALRGSRCRKEAAEQLGISERTLRYKLSRLRESGVPIPRHRMSA